MADSRLNRRDFLRVAGLSAAGIAVGGGVSPAGGAGLAGAAEPTKSDTFGSAGLPERLGKYYKVPAPDTLDLAERARLAVSHLTSIISEEHGYGMYVNGVFNHFGPAFSDAPRPAMISPSFDGCLPKCMEALVMGRLMSGSTQGLEREAKMVQMKVSQIGDDGICWMPPGRSAGFSKPWANVHGQARMVRGMVAWYQYTGDRTWKERIDRMVDGIDRYLVVHKDGYAYIPVDASIDDDRRGCPDPLGYVKGRGWKDTTEPASEKSGEEGSLFNHEGHTPGVLANWYMMTGNKQALRLSGELVRFLTKPKFWADWKGGDYPNVIGAEHAHWTGHFYGHINTLRAVLEYAIATNDVQLKGFVRDGYEWARHAWLMGPIGFGANGQGCATPRIIGLAVKLSDAGIGDYWEDVDRYIRNHGTEMQFTPEDIPYLEKFEKREPTAEQRSLGATTNGVIEASMGAFAGNPFKHHWVICCSPHGAMGLFYSWDGTLRYADGVARVNLLLNRASPWMDIDSYLPYEGKVVLKNKAAREVFVRISLWVDKKTVSCRIGNRKVNPVWFGNYLSIEHLKAEDVITIEFAVKEWAERWTTDETLIPFLPGWPGKVTRSFRFKANTLVDITPPIPNWPLDHGEWWLYRNRARKYRAAKAPMKEVTRFVTPFDLKW